MELIGRNLAKGFGLTITEREVSASSLYSKLLDNNAITGLQFQLTKKIIDLCNAAVHGKHVSNEEAESILDTAKILAEDYLKWLTWKDENKNN
ncbi:MAG: hypothetical protein ABFD50_10300 [Smithella sp.]